MVAAAGATRRIGAVVVAAAAVVVVEVHLARPPFTASNVSLSFFPQSQKPFSKFYSGITRLFVHRGGGRNSRKPLKTV